MLRQLLPAMLLVFVCLQSSTALGQGAANELNVDNHWIGIIQQDGGDTLMVKEILLFNNTGTTTYNGTIQAKLAPATRYSVMSIVRADGGLDYLKLSLTENHLIEASPFPYYMSFLSYYGQHGEALLRVSDENGSVVLAQSIVLGTQSEGGAVNSSENNLTLKSAKGIIGVSLGNTLDIPKNMTLLHTITIRNEVAEQRTIELEVLGLPAGWGGWLLSETGNSTIELGPHEIQNLTLHVQIPSYLLNVQIEYAYQMAVPEGSLKRGSYSKELIYNHTELEVFLFVFTDANVTVKGDVKLVSHQYFSAYDREWYISNGTALNPGDHFEQIITWQEEAETGSNWLWLALIGGTLVGMCVLIVWASGWFDRESDPVTENDKSPDEIDERNEDGSTHPMEEA